jgi:hypothetical protein
MSTPAKVAGLLAGLRQAGKTARPQAMHPAVPEVLLWIAAGVDHRQELVKVSELSEREVRRICHTLCGKGYRQRGGYVDSAYRLVEVRRHPHRRGEQLLLTREGQQLISSTFDLQHEESDAGSASGLD